MSPGLHDLRDLSPLKIAIGYLCLGVPLVPAANVVLARLVGAHHALSPSALVGGWVLVVASAWFIYGMTVLHHRQMASARRELETSNQQLQVLSRVLRHNIRNDLNVVRGYTNLLEDRVDDDQSEQYLETIRETTDDVVAISEKLRLVETVDPDLHDGDVDLVAVVQRAIDDVGDDEQVDVRLDAPTEARIRADDSVGYPVREVLENAIAHNDKPVCRLAVSIESNGEDTRLEVVDNGPGIPESERNVLRAETETPLSHASSIGLWLVKWMCELQGGDVSFDADDEGTRVTLRFRSAGTTSDGTPSRPSAAD